MKQFYYAVTVLLYLTACSIRHSSLSDELGVRVVHHAVLAVSTEAVRFPFGGISGIDYDAKHNKYVAISDDKGEFGPPRAYLFRLSRNNQVEHIKEVVLTFGQESDIALLEVDPESVRFLSSDSIIWASELGNVFVTDLNAGRTSEFKIPIEFLPSDQVGSGARNNKFIEGISFLEGRKKVVFALESSLKQDGPVATTEAGAFTRILVFDFAKQKLLNEYLYPLDPIPLGSIATPPWSDNGVSEVLAIDDRRLLILERSGRHIGNMNFEYNVRCYLVSIAGTELALANSIDSETLEILEKELVFEMSDLIDTEEKL